jgi:hypothetical protein
MLDFLDRDGPPLLAAVLFAPKSHSSFMPE